MFQGGVTDINTAKSVARKLYMQYCNGGQMERLAMERMLIDTYRIMVTSQTFRTNSISLLVKTLISITTSLTSIVTVESPSMIFKL